MPHILYDKISPAPERPRQTPRTDRDITDPYSAAPTSGALW